MKMKMSRKGLEFLEKEEGFVGHVYNDFAGVPSIGIGHAIKPGEKFTTMSREDALVLLALDVGVAEDNVNKRVKVPLTQDQFDALVSFTFNLGGGALANSTLLKLLNTGDYAAAAAELPKWSMYTDRADGNKKKRSPTLLNRRRREMKLFLGSA